VMRIDRGGPGICQMDAVASMLQRTHQPMFEFPEK